MHMRKKRRHALCQAMLIFLLIAVGLTACVPMPGARTEPTSPLTPNPYSPEDFSVSGGFVTCTAGKYMTGIDVSEWQGQIDWAAVRASGVEFAILRVGWRGSEKGVLTADTLAQEYYDGAKQAGILVGAYFFSQAIDVAEALEEAEFALSCTEGWELDMPFVFDWEYVDEFSRTAGVSADMLTEISTAFCDCIAQAGYTPMLYFNGDQAQSGLLLDRLYEYPFWLARYATALDYPYRVDMWQYSDAGSVDGIRGKVDLDIKFIYES